MNDGSYDALVVGAGPAGSAAAISLSRRGAKVAIIERRRAAEDRMGEALGSVARETLRELGVWEGFLRSEQRPSHFHRAAWGGQLQERYALQNGGPDWHLDRARFDTLLLDAAVARGATLLRPATLLHAAVEGKQVRMSVRLGSQTLQLRARFAIDATGRGAKVATGWGSRRRHVDRLIGIARSFERAGREPSTLVEVADAGWWYSAPQPGDRMLALFVTDGDSPARMARRTEIWQRCLDSAPLTRERLEAARFVSPPRAYLATPAILDWDPRLPLFPVGDAAYSCDPIAAEGLCFALRSGIEAADASLGLRGSASAYHAGVRLLYRNHLARRELIYAAERRLRATPFWQRPR
jgi:2-polyprenyl-6-methoxyphenol hydroxylase-like FAD-dependent oxidoreductase